MTKNRTPTPVYLDPGMHPGLEVKGLTTNILYCRLITSSFHSDTYGCIHHNYFKILCSASDRQGSNFESCVWRTVSSQSSHHPQEVLLAQFSLYVHKGGLKPDSFHFCFKILYLSLNCYCEHGGLLQAPPLYFVRLTLNIYKMNTSPPAFYSTIDFK